MEFRETLNKAIAVARGNGYTVRTREKTGCIVVEVVSPSGRSEYEYYFFLDSDSETLSETLNDLINWVS